MKVELISSSIGRNSYDTLNNEEIIAAVARHGKIKEDNGKLVKYLMDNSHWSPLQHIFFGFKIETSRAISAQIFRHRSLHFQETSQRYEEITEFEDIELRKQHAKNRQSSTEICKFTNEDTIKISDASYGAGSHMFVQDALEGYFRYSQELYKGLLNLGVAKECARMILPMCSKTTIHVSGTLRDLLAFLNIRCDEHAQLEVRNIATKMGEELEKELPNIFSNIDWRNGLFM
jgi:thymidylate synthase (FAD)